MLVQVLKCSCILLSIIFFLFKQKLKPSDIQGQVDPLFPEVILCVEIYNSRKVKVLYCSVNL